MKKQYDAASVYSCGNKYGYRYSLNNPTIFSYYKRFLKWKGLSQRFPLTDSERAEFEQYMDSVFLSPPVKLKSLL